MNWKIRALCQKAVAALPSAVSYGLYNQLQKTLGQMNTQSVDPTLLFQRTSSILTEIVDTGQSVAGASFLEVGTGWKLTIPMALWLCGARKVITVDLNPYLRPDLVQREVEYICRNRDLVTEIFAGIADSDYVYEQIEKLDAITSPSLQEVMSIMKVEYLAPADVSDLALGETIDYCISHTVLEHIPRAKLAGILNHTYELLRTDGLSVHFIDPSDHFSHRDPDISDINFLQFSESQWDFWADNRYSYHNRLRVDDYKMLFEQTKHRIVNEVAECDPDALQLLESGFPLAVPFATKPTHVNASTWLLLTAQK